MKTVMVQEQTMMTVQPATTLKSKGILDNKNNWTVDKSRSRNKETLTQLNNILGQYVPVGYCAWKKTSIWISLSKRG